MLQPFDLFAVTPTCLICAPSTFPLPFPPGAPKITLARFQAESPPRSYCERPPDAARRRGTVFAAPHGDAPRRDFTEDAEETGAAGKFGNISLFR